MKKSMFNNDESFTHDALELSARAERILRSAFKRYMARGYSAREISHVILHEVQRVEPSVILEARRKGLYLDEDKK